MPRGGAGGAPGAPDFDDAAQPARRKLLQVDADLFPRPAYWGTWPPERPREAAAALRRGRAPLARAPELDYEIDSAEEWEEEEAGESLSDSDAEEDADAAAGGGSDADAEGDGFVVADGYLSDDEVVMTDAAALAGAEDADADAAAFGSPSRAGAVSAEDAAAARAAMAAARAAERLRATLEACAERARKQNKPLLVTLLPLPGAPVTPAPPAASAAAAALASPPPAPAAAEGEAQPASAAPASAAPAGGALSAAQLLAAFAMELQHPRLVITAAPAAGEAAAGGDAFNAAPALDAGGASGAPSGRGRKPAEFPEALLPDLVRHLLAAPGQPAPKAAAAFASAHAGKVTKVATKEKIPSLAEYTKRRWCPNAAALAAAGLSAAEAKAIGDAAPMPPKAPKAPKPAAAAADVAVAAAVEAEDAEEEEDAMEVAAPADENDAAAPQDVPMADCAAA